MNCSFAAPQGYCVVEREGSSNLRKILSVRWWETLHFHVGYIDKSARVQIVRRMIGGFYKDTWEVLGRPGSTHRLPNGATISIGKEYILGESGVWMTTLHFRPAPLMWRSASPVAAV